jgi:hypothetical protein
LGEGRWWKPHVWLALQDSKYIWERWGMKKDIIYRQTNLRLYTDWHRMCKACKDEIKSQETTRVSEWVVETRQSILNKIYIPCWLQIVQTELLFLGKVIITQSNDFVCAR